MDFAEERAHTKCDFSMHEELPSIRKRSQGKSSPVADGYLFDENRKWISMHGMANGMQPNDQAKRKRKTNWNPENGVCRTHSDAFPIHSTPFNRIFLIYFHYASKRASLMSPPSHDPVQRRSLARTYTHTTAVDGGEAVTSVGVVFPVHLCGTIQSVHTYVHVDRTPSEVLLVTLALCFHFASHRSFH